MSEFLPWARGFTGARLVGGDFNDDPSSAPIIAIKHEYVDAFATKGSGPGGTHSHDDKTYVSRIDYLFSAGGLRVNSAHVPQVALSDHRPVVASYSTTSTGAQPTATPPAATSNPPAATNPGVTVPPTPNAPTTTVPMMLQPTAPASASASATTAGDGSSSGETFCSTTISTPASIPQSGRRRFSAAIKTCGCPFSRRLQRSASRR